MLKTELIELVALSTRQPIPKVKMIVDSMLRNIGRELATDTPVRLHHFGRFYTTALRLYTLPDPNKPTHKIILPTKLYIEFNGYEALNTLIANRLNQQEHIDESIYLED